MTSKAFDAIPHNLLNKEIIDSRLPPNFSRWLACYLHGRAARVLYQRAASSFLPIRTGVPQGSVISPCLFNFFVSDYPDTADLQTSYADDFTAVTSSPSVPAAAEHLSRHASDVRNWAKAHGLQISLSKSHVTLFTSDTHQSRMDPLVSLSASPLRLVRQPRILGVTLDTHFTFGPHVRRTADSARARLKILKALAGVSFGQSKETLLLTYTMMIKPVINYCAPVWYPNASGTAIRGLQTVQNAALRIATSSLLMASLIGVQTHTVGWCSNTRCWLVFKPAVGWSSNTRCWLVFKHALLVGVQTRAVGWCSNTRCWLLFTRAVC